MDDLELVKRRDAICMYFDESHIQQGAYAAVGCLWGPKESLILLDQELKQARRRRGRSSFEGEISWSGRNRVPLKRKFAELFFRSEEPRFAMLLIEREHIGYKSGGIHWLYWQLLHCLNQGGVFDILRRYKLYFDHHHERPRSWCKDVKLGLNDLLCSGSLPIDKVRNLDSAESNLIQLTDILTGAISSKMNTVSKAPAKVELRNFIASKAGCRIQPADEIEHYEKFNIWVLEAQQMTIPTPHRFDVP